MVYPNSTIFQQIIEGKIPAYKIYEDELFIVILDIAPKQLGHSLIIPKEYKEDIFNNSPEIVNSINTLAIKVSNKLKLVLGASGTKWMFNNGTSAGQEVFHTHMHIIPYYNDFTTPIVTQELTNQLSEALKK